MSQRSLPETSVEPAAALPPDPRWELVERVTRSASFQRSHRLRDFLAFTCRQALLHPDRQVREYEIRSEVFGRPLDVDAADDTLVRVQASHLRKRLERYFATEGAGEPVVIDLPRGTYTPVFREREGVSAPAVVLPEAQPTAGRRRRVWLAAAAATALALTCTYAGWRWGFAQGIRQPLADRPGVDRLWRDMFGAAPLYVVLADSNLTMFQDLMKYQMTLPEYQRQGFAQQAEQVKYPGMSGIARTLMNRDYTSIADATLTQRVGTLAALQGRSLDVVLARRADPVHVQSRNVVLAGSRRANPWLELFEPRLNFQSRFEEEAGRRCSLVNRAPLPGEEAVYAATWNHMGYCRVAYLPNLGGNGSVLILSGTDMSSTDACSEFVTSERWVQRLFTRLGVTAGQKVPHFEVLLQTQLLLGTSPSFELVAHRLVRS